MKRGTREYTLWSVGMFVIIVVALIPVLWIALAVAQGPGDDRRRRA